MEEEEGKEEEQSVTVKINTAGFLSILETVRRNKSLLDTSILESTFQVDLLIQVFLWNRTSGSYCLSLLIMEFTGNYFAHYLAITLIGFGIALLVAERIYAKDRKAEE